MDCRRQARNTAEVLGTERFLVNLDPSKVSIKEEPRVNDGTTVVLFKLPVADYISPFRIVETVALLNPRTTLTFKDKEVEQTFEALEDASPSSQTDVDIHCYSLAEFGYLADEIKHITVERLVTIFKGLKHRSYAREILDELEIQPGTRLSDIGSKELESLYNAIKEAAKSIKATQLPLVGQDAFENFGAVGYSVKRGVWSEDGRIVPYAVEVASFEGEGEDIIETINFSASIHHPFTMWVRTEGERRVKLHDLIKDKGVTVLIHLVCPAITWLNASKGEMDIEPFGEKIFSAVRSVCKQNTRSGFDSETLTSLANKVMCSYPTLNFTIRQVFYRLVALHGYPNTRQSYNKLGKALVMARQEGSVDADRIVDLSRPEYVNNSQYQSFLEKVESDFKAMVENFDLDMWDQQPFFCETWTEKEALSRVLMPVCQKYRVNLIVGRGYSSYTQIRRAVKRFPEGKKVILMYIGDFDPTGRHIEVKLIQRLHDQIRRSGKDVEVEVKRIALTYEQIKQHDLPSSPLKKFGQKRNEYYEEYGDNVWEADALSPEVLMKTLEEEIRILIDWEIWDKKEEEVEYFRKLLRERLGRLLDELRAFE